MAFAQRLIATRRGAVLLSALAALLAGILIVVYVSRYRNSVNADSAPVTVLIAKQAIPKGTAGSTIATTGLYSATTIRQSQLLNGAYSDASSLRDRVATRDIYPGSQLTAADFAPAATQHRVNADEARAPRDDPVRRDARTHPGAAGGRPRRRLCDLQPDSGEREPAFRSEAVRLTYGVAHDHEQRLCRRHQERQRRLQGHRQAGRRSSPSLRTTGSSGSPCGRARAHRRRLRRSSPPRR